MSQKIKWKVEEVKGARGKVVSIDHDFVRFESHKGGLRIIPINSVIEISETSEFEPREKEGEKDG